MKFLTNLANLAAPFKVVCHFKYFALWWITILVTLLGPVIDASIQAENKFEYFINSGTLYYSVITLLFSYVVTNAIDMIFEVIHENEKLPFIVFQIVSIIFAVVSIFILTFLYIYFRSNAKQQIIISIIGYIFSFYLYCVSCMPRVKEELLEHAWSYDEQKKKHSDAVQNSNDSTSDGIDL